MRKVFIVLGILVVGLMIWLLWPQNSDSLVLYSAVDYGPLVAKGFEKKTGIKVRVVTSSTGQLLARIAAEGSRPSWDIAWFDGAIAASSLDKNGLVAKISVKPTLFNNVGKRLLPPSLKWIPTGYTLSGVFVYKAKGIRPPMGFDGLVRKKYHASVGMNNPAISGPTFPLVAAMLKRNGGWPLGKAYLDKLASSGLHVFAKNKYTLQGLEQGKIRIAMVQSSAAYALVSKYPSKYAVSLPREAYILPRVIVASKGLSKRKMKMVRAFVKYALSRAVIKRTMKRGHSDGYYWSVSSSSHFHRKILPAAQTLHLSTLEPAHWGDLEATINNWFTSHIVNP